jgi:hypothetical protein
MNEQVLKLISEKGSTAIDTFNRTKVAFDVFKTELQKLESALRSSVLATDPRVTIGYDDKGKLEVHFHVANDVLVFLMQTHVFNFENSHSIHRSSYAKADSTRTQCGMICIYNFLTDSFKFGRLSDNGILIARVFINKDGHYFVDGNKQLGFLFNNFDNDEITETNINAIINAALTYALESDVLVPEYQNMQITNVQDLSSRSGVGFESGKGFGFQLQKKDGVN